MNVTEQPRLSVVLPNYNHAAYLPSCLDSLLHQSVAPFEVIAVDDGSTDNSVEILKSYARKHPNLRLVQNERNLGCNPTVNRGLELARGDYVFATAADDEILPGFFEKSLRLLAQHPQAALCCTICTWRYTDSGLSWHMGAGMAEQPSFLSPDQLVGIGQRGKLAISSSSVIVRTRLLQDAGGFDPQLRWHSDWFFYYTCALRHGACYVPEPLSVVNILSDSQYRTGRKRPEHHQVLLRILELLNSPAHADVRGRVRDSGVLSVFEFRMLRLLLSRSEYRSFVNWPFLRWTFWRRAELTGSEILPRWLARWFLDRFYRHATR